MGKEALFQTSDEDRVELQPLGRVNGHELNGILSLGCLIVTGLKGCMTQEHRQRTGQWHHRITRIQDDTVGLGNGLYHLSGLSRIHGHAHA